jgi:hypothetical protein
MSDQRPQNPFVWTKPSSGEPTGSNPSPFKFGQPPEGARPSIFGASAVPNAPRSVLAHQPSHSSVFGAQQGQVQGSNPRLGLPSSSFAGFGEHKPPAGFKRDFGQVGTGSDAGVGFPSSLMSDAERQPAAKKTLFGGQGGLGSGVTTFGGPKPTPSNAASSVFGGSAFGSTTSIFKNPPAASLFGASAPSTSLGPSVFGQPAGTTPSFGSFGSKSEPVIEEREESKPTSHVFGTFGPPPPRPVSSTATSSTPAFTSHSSTAKSDEAPVFGSGSSTFGTFGSAAVKSPLFGGKDAGESRQDVPSFGAKEPLFGARPGSESTKSSAPPILFGKPVPLGQDFANSAAASASESTTSAFPASGSFTKPNAPNPFLSQSETRSTGTVATVFGKPKKPDEGGASKGVFSRLGLPGKRPGSQVLSEAEDGRTEAKVERRAPPPVYENPFDASRPPPPVYEDTFSDAGDGGVVSQPSEATVVPRECRK